MSILQVTDGLPPWVVPVYKMGVKLASDAEVSYNLVGPLYYRDGRIMLSVPNALVRGIFSAMHEPGIELPKSDDGETVHAHIIVMKPKELQTLGGPDKVTERGKQFEYTLGRLYTAESDWPGVARVWFVRVHSPALQQLRKSYGLPALPEDGTQDFHVVCAIRKKGILAANEKSKGQE